MHMPAAGATPVLSVIVSGFRATLVFNQLSSLKVSSLRVCTQVSHAKCEEAKASK